MSHVIKPLSDWLISKLSLCTTFILIRIVFNHPVPKSYPEVHDCTSIMPYYNYLHFVSIKGLRSMPGLLGQIAVAGLNQSELAVLKGIISYLITGCSH